jgi:hypothetical protein
VQSVPDVALNTSRNYLYVEFMNATGNGLDKEPVNIYSKVDRCARRVEYLVLVLALLRHQHMRAEYYS